MFSGNLSGLCDFFSSRLVREQYFVFGRSVTCRIHLSSSNSLKRCVSPLSVCPGEALDRDVLQKIKDQRGWRKSFC